MIKKYPIFHIYRIPSQDGLIEYGIALPMTYYSIFRLYYFTVLEFWTNSYRTDQNDDAMVRWKQSLGLGTGESISDPNDPRKCIIKSLAMVNWQAKPPLSISSQRNQEVDGRPDIVIDVSAPGAAESLKSKPFIIKEGTTYRMKATFVVQHEVLSGLKYVQQVKRKGIPVGKDQEMIGSFPPNTTDRRTHSKSFAPEEAPSGMLVRGKYEAVSKFVDDDNVTHLKFEWSFEIAKDWPKH